MGTWAIPQTDEAVNRLEQLMASPVSASGAADALYPLVGDDTLFDMIGMAAESDSKPGLGTGIVEALAKQLDATVELADQAPGTKVTVAHLSREPRV